MKTLYFATTNQEKIQIAQTACARANINIEAVALDIDEIQGEDPELIVLDKAQRAYNSISAPTIVSDDTWDIRALRGFPGAYMKSINYWFEPQDFLRLMEGIQDRHITLRQYLAYTDGNITKVFRNDINGSIISEVRGKNKKSPNMTITVLDADNGRTIAEVFEQGTDAVAARHKNQPDAWHQFIEWYKLIPRQ